MPKKVAIISDIQGNFVALKDVFDQLDAESIEQVICLGDVASGAQPKAVLNMLRDKQVQVVKGNMDDTILNPRPHNTDDVEIKYYDEIDLWCSQQLSELDKVYIRSFRPTLVNHLTDTMQLLCFHGSPYSYNSVIDETTSEDELTQLLDGYDEAIMATGHMHHPFLRIFHNSWIINPGSVGLPRKHNGKHPLHAEYALLEVEDERFHLSFRQIRIDADEFTQGIRESGMPRAEWFLSQWDI